MKFKWWQWWSDWQDIGTFSFAGNGYLLQGSRSRTNKARFRCAAFKAFIDIAHAPEGTYKETP